MADDDAAAEALFLLGDTTIPVRPVEDRSPTGHVYKRWCPRCGEDIRGHHYHVGQCQFCGQAWDTTYMLDDTAQHLAQHLDLDVADLYHEQLPQADRSAEALALAVLGDKSVVLAETDDDKCPGCGHQASSEAWHWHRNPCRNCGQPLERRSVLNALERDLSQDWIEP